MASYLSCTVAGTELRCFPEKAIYWPEKETLIVADLHWGKAETFQRAGIPVPQEGLQEDLERLSQLLEKTGARRMIFLGDVLHSRTRLSEELSYTILAWRRQCPQDILWIEGNHDRGAKNIPKEWDMEFLQGQWVEDVFCFAHEPSAARSGLYTLCGHIHPVVHLRSRLDRMRLPCFWFEESMGILPSFGSFTGGAEVKPSARGTLFAIADHRVWELS